MFLHKVELVVELESTNSQRRINQEFVQRREFGTYEEKNRGRALSQKNFYFEETYYTHLQKLKTMIRHSVVLKLKYSAGSPEEKKFLDEAWKLKSIPGVLKFEVMKEISSNNPYEFGISMEFEDQETYDFYSNHPDHVRFVQEIWIPNVEAFMEIDYLV